MEFPRTARTPSRRFVPAVVLTGVAAGATGWFFVRILHEVERIAYGLTTDTLLHAAEQTPPLRRLAMLIVAGVVGAVSWYLLRRSGRAPVAVRDAVAGWRMPLLTTFWHATTQVVIVGLGASIGREVAPREMSAALSGWLADRLRLTREDRAVLVACGAGAGLAAVYSIPLSGAVFALEVLVVRLTPRTVWPALAISGIAVLVAHGWSRSTPFYTVPELRATASLTVWAAVCGPLLGVLGHLFDRAVRSCERARPTAWRLLVVMPCVFALVGVIAVWVPEVLGNGQATAQPAFDAGTGAAAAGAVAVFLVAKVVATLGTIRSGAWGGTLTPGVAIGACLGALTGIAWSAVWPGTQIAAFAFIGAAAFLGTSMRAPFTALVLVMEFTHQGAGILVPSVLAVAGAVAAVSWVGRRLPERPATHEGGDADPTGPVLPLP